MVHIKIENKNRKNPAIPLKKYPIFSMEKATKFRVYHDIFRFKKRQLE
jgi:hypothetical protein